MSREEAEAEAAWDPTEADPLQQQSYTFDNLYSLNDAVPDDVREELTRVGYGPPVRASTSVTTTPGSVTECARGDVRGLHRTTNMQYCAHGTCIFHASLL